MKLLYVSGRYVDHNDRPVLCDSFVQETIGCTPLAIDVVLCEEAPGVHVVRTDELYYKFDTHAWSRVSYGAFDEWVVRLKLHDFYIRMEAV
jgi:hypothetical protein